MPAASDRAATRNRRAHNNGNALASSPILGLIARSSIIVPALVLAFPMLVWPLIEGPGLPPDGANLPVMPTSEPGALNRLYFPPLFLWAFIGFLAASRERLKGLFEPAMLLLVLILLWAGTTAIWSLDFTLVTRRVFLQITIVGAMLMPVLVARRVEQILDPMLVLAWVVTLANLAVVLTSPPGPLGHEGIYPQKNYLGAVMGGIVLLGLPRLLAGRAWQRIACAALIVLALGILLLSKSKTSLALAVIAPALGVVLLAASRNLRITPAIAMPVFGGLCYGIYQLGAHAHLWDFNSFATVVFGDPTLTSRTDIWAFAIKMIERKPWFGWGYEAFWGISFEAPSVREAPGFVAKMPHAHNGYLDAILQMGVVGFVLLMALLLAALHATHRLAKREPLMAFFALATIVFAIGHNFLESTWFHGFNMISMLFVLTIGLGARSGGRTP